MYNGTCNGCGTIADIIRGANSCADCMIDRHETNENEIKRAAENKRAARYFANKKRRAGGTR